MHEIKTEDVYIDCNYNNDKEMFALSNYSLKSKYDTSYKIVVDRIKDETADVTIGEFVGLKPKIYLYLADNNIEHEKTKECKQKCCCDSKSR